MFFQERKKNNAWQGTVTKIIQIRVTEASEKTAGGHRDRARIGEVTFYAKDREVKPTLVAADSNEGHGYSAKQTADGLRKFRYRELGPRGWASSPSPLPRGRARKPGPCSTFPVPSMLPGS